jgi:hypothetical protein
MGANAGSNILPAITLNQKPDAWNRNPEAGWIYRFFIHISVGWSIIKYPFGLFGYPDFLVTQKEQHTETVVKA